MEIGNAPTQVVIKKVDDKGKALTGATFNVVDKDGNVVRFNYEKGIYYWSADGTETEVKVDQNGQAVLIKLPMGDYTLKEIKAPDGYQKAGEVQAFKVTSENEEVEVINKPIPPKPSYPPAKTCPPPKGGPTPSTGDSTLAWIVGAVIAVAVGAGLLVFTSKNKKKREETEDESKG